jgi:pimeloyl-ACP methyl ester carboxylesterase
MALIDDRGRSQAVVVIHGIGEQRPMATLRSFVGALLDRKGDRPGARYYSKPDTISDSYELRRIKLHRPEQGDKNPPAGLDPDWPQTDFYEYYWAHQMYGTTVSHVVRWLVLTLSRARHFIRPADTGFPRLRRLAIWAWLMIGALLCAAAALFWLEPNVPWLQSPVRSAGAVAVLWACWQVARYYAMGTVLDVAGDAARYFDVNPKNVARRYDILRGGIALLRKLHEERDVLGDRVMYRYGRIVLVGHSLGSVIAYDILRHYWGEVNGRIPVEPDAGILKSVEGFVASRQDSPLPPIETYRTAPTYWIAQRTLWKAIRDRAPAGLSLSSRELWQRRADERFGAPPPVDQPAAGEEPPKDWQPTRWLVSDLVTMGSPLAYAPVLLANGLDDLDEKRRLRELPTCPPDRSRSVNPGHYSVDLQGEVSGFGRYHILHHGACFASTRWTNLWYDNDPVGGPLPAAFGCGIRDICLTDGPSLALKSHISYWRRLPADRRPESIRILEEILCDGDTR